MTSKIAEEIKKQRIEREQRELANRVGDDLLPRTLIQHKRTNEVFYIVEALDVSYTARPRHMGSLRPNYIGKAEVAKDWVVVGTC